MLEQKDQDKGSISESEGSSHALVFVRNDPTDTSERESKVKRDFVREVDKATIVTQSELFNHSLNSYGSNDSDLNHDDRMLQRMILMNFMAR